MKDTVISTHKWSVHVRNYMENTWTRLETVPEEMSAILYMYGSWFSSNQGSKFGETCQMV